MCQMSVLLEEEDRRETIMENATRLELTADGVVVSTLFEEPKTVLAAHIREIDFLNNTVLLVRNPSTLEACRG